MVGGGRRQCCSGHSYALKPLRWKEECTIVGVVKVVVGPQGLCLLGGRGRICAGGYLCQLIFELLHLLRESLQRVGVVCRDGVGKRLRVENSMVKTSYRK